MSAPLTVALPTADRPTTYRFYGKGLGFEAVGELADDGVPEPLQFVLDDGARLMFIPTGGFGWVTGDHETAPPGTSECLLSLNVESDAEVDEYIEKAQAAGAVVLAEPEQKPWGYLALFADPDTHLWQVIHPT